MKAIETSYKGYRFRSRLEARWAVFFDALGLHWEYEPEGYETSAGWYLPDFKVDYPDCGAVWFEVKSDLRSVSESEWRKMLAFDYGVIVLDGPPALRMYRGPQALLEDEHLPCRLCAGALHDRRAGWALHSYKDRPWWDEHENFFDPERPNGWSDIEMAVTLALSSRFEHGQFGPSEDTVRKALARVDALALKS